MISVALALSASTALTPAGTQKLFDEVAAIIVPVVACESQFNDQSRSISLSTYSLRAEYRKLGEMSEEQERRFAQRLEAIRLEQAELEQEKEQKCQREAALNQAEEIIRQFNPEVHDSDVQTTRANLVRIFAQPYSLLNQHATNTFPRPTLPPPAPPSVKAQ